MDEMSEKRAVSGSKLFDDFVKRGCDPDVFNRAFAKFTAASPVGDFSAAVKSLSDEKSASVRAAKAAELFGRSGIGLLQFIEVE